jgi:hypothetical protein
MKNINLKNIHKIKIYDISQKKIFPFKEKKIKLKILLFFFSINK